MADLPSKAQAQLGMTPGTRFFTCNPFAGMNVQSTPPNIDDREFVLNENFFHLGDGNLRTAWDVEAPALIAAPPGTTIIYFFAFSIGQENYQAVFLDDGSAFQANTATGQVTQIGPAGTFYRKSTPQKPVCTQWGASYLLIANRNSLNDFWAWDGSLLYTAGTATPNGASLTSVGQNYATLPSVTAFGGHGSGMTFLTTIQAGGVVNVQITNPGTGYQVGDIVQLAFSGGGSDRTPQIIANLTNGGVGAANVTAGGTGYTSAPTVAFSGGGGTGAAGTAIVGSGVTSVTVTAGGTGYDGGAVIGFTGGGGTGATADATVVGGVITQIAIANPGTGYTSAPTVTIAGSGSGATATAAIQNGIVTGITITAPGTGYSTAPTITLTGGGGSGASAVSLLNPTGVESVTVVDGGTGFLYAPNITFEGGGGAGAAGVVFLHGTSIAKINLVSGGSGYQVPPTVVFSGGGPGSGAAATANIANGQVVSITLTNGGSGYTTNVEVYIKTFTDTKNPENNDTGSGAGAIAIFNPTSIAGVLISNSGLQYTSAPSVVINSGANNAAYGVVGLMPYGVSGSTMESFQSRLWIANPDAQNFATIAPGGVFQVSAPGSFTDFATSDGGVLFTSSDGFLQRQYIHLQASNGYLYAIGDGSISVISSVTTAGTPTTTTFNYQTVDPDIGGSWRDAVASFSRTILLANETGVYGIYGGAATKVSDKLNDLFDKAIFPPTAGAIEPSAGTATIHNVRHYFMLMTMLDPATGQMANKMITWNERDWFVTSQTVTLNFIGSQKIDSRQTLWGTDGLQLVRLFQKPSGGLTKRLWTKHYGGAQSMFIIKDLTNFYVQAQDNSGSGIDLTVDFVVSGIAVQSTAPDEASVQSGIAQNYLYVPPSFSAPAPYWPVFGAGSGGFSFMTVGVEIATTSPDFTLSGLLIGYRDIKADQ